MAMTVQLKVWRQAGPNQPGRLVDYTANNVHPDMSFLEMLDVVNEQLIKKGEDPIAFTRRAAHRIRHVHLKDYRAQFTPEGFRLVRCAIGDGAVPFSAPENAGPREVSTLGPPEVSAKMFTSRSGDRPSGLHKASASPKACQ